MIYLAAIRPEDTDDRSADFTSRIGTATITASTWTAAVSPFSIIIDPTPSNILSGASSHTGSGTTQRFHNCMNECTYWLGLSVTLSDGRILTDQAELVCSDNPLPVLPIPRLTPDQFRLDFPVFASDTAYTEDSITFWLSVASKLLNESRFLDMYDTALELYVAHQITLERVNGILVAKGGVPLTIGPQTSKSVGPASVSYDLNLSLEEGAGYFNLTVYGQRLWQLIMMFGAGPVQIF